MKPSDQNEGSFHRKLADPARIPRFDGLDECHRVIATAVDHAIDGRPRDTDQGRPDECGQDDFGHQLGDLRASAAHRIAPVFLAYRADRAYEVLGCLVGLQHRVADSGRHPSPLMTSKAFCSSPCASCMPH
jgi:hypothetical protein